MGIETYTIDEITSALKLHPYTVRQVYRERRVPASEFGGQWGFNKEEIDSFANKKQQPSSNQER